VCAADGQSPWDRGSLYVRLVANWNTNGPVTNSEEEINKIRKEQQELLERYKIPSEVERICRSLALLSHLRLETRLHGWMALEYVVVKELIPQLCAFVPYTAWQLESCTPEELAHIMEGGTAPTPVELDERAQYVVAGVYKGEEVLWLEREAEELFTPLLPVIDYSLKELKGQPAMRGNVTGLCHVIAWDIELSADQMEAMPEGAVLVAGQTRPQLMPAIRKASAIITDEGGVLSHAAIVSRELKIPCVIGTKYATKILKSGDRVEVDADNGVIRIIK
jgi:phosphohistidine swiveling domain-containing protein